VKVGTLIEHWVSKRLGVIVATGQHTHKVLWFNTNRIRRISPQRMREV
jgi:hypothetical protein